MTTQSILWRLLHPWNEPCIYEVRSCAKTSKERSAYDKKNNACIWCKPDSLRLVQKLGHPVSEKKKREQYTVTLWLSTCLQYTPSGSQSFLHPSGCHQIVQSLNDGWSVRLICNVSFWLVYQNVNAS
jgi:hypothetical protein